ncbi:P-type ATPase [Jimgerdemannia flammicorona]|uniref:P-type ATPase n=1 Tax=Jimgerdemannia flammicorona TaxID=994334 RepID=A0A433Q3D8_9FUNG|nr:P-type ATPase [Jimgerdemannia flammicorona]
MISIVIQAITIIVVAVPEGLPMAVTLSLAFATTQMLRDNNLVRVLSACETMGNATAVCSDKTGTLTQNKMTVVEGSLAQKTFDNIDKAKDWHQQVQPDVATLIVESIAVNSNAFEGKDDNGRPAFVGSKTECALLGFAQSLGYDYAHIRSSAKIAKVYPFASQKKTMSVVTRNHDGVAKSKGQKDYRVFVKGASEIVLQACTHYLDDQGNVHSLNGDARSQFDIIITKYAEKALRTITLAYRDVSTSEFNKFTDDEPPNRDLVCIGVVGIQDPLRPGVVEAVAAFRKAGVFVRMVCPSTCYRILLCLLWNVCTDDNGLFLFQLQITGDNLTTASAIARNAGILTPGGIALTGPEFRGKTPEEQAKIVPRLQVLARSSPTDKTIVVTRLQQADEVVAMTGDGTNDGPALKLADVGFSMGIAGTEVAKEASDIILMDDNFNSILKALRWGRAVVNLIMDTLAALALATEPPTDDLLERKPAPKRAHLINYRMAKMIVGQAIFQIGINLFLINLGGAIFHLDNKAHGKAVLKTIIFNTFVFLQIFNEINCRCVLSAQVNNI